MPNYHAISRERHVRKFWQRCPDFAFAAADAFVPLTAVELAKAATALPIGFVKQGEGFIPVAVLSPVGCAIAHADARMMVRRIVGPRSPTSGWQTLRLRHPSRRGACRHPVPRTRSHG